MMSSPKFLVTGALGCIGAWVVRNLLQADYAVVIYDVGTNRQRLQLVLSDEEMSRIQYAESGDVTSLDMLKRAFEANGITHVIHLAAIQVPFCRANPPLGAQINVTGTVNLFEAAKSAGVKQVVYASSIAVYGPREVYPPGLLRHDAPLTRARITAFTSRRMRQPPACITRSPASAVLDCARIRFMVPVVIRA